jgi:hypothetical protein
MTTLANVFGSIKVKASIDALYLMKLGNILCKKIRDAFYRLTKLDLKDSVGLATPAKKKLLLSLSQYSIYIGNEDNEYFLDLNVF